MAASRRVDITSAITVLACMAPLLASCSIPTSDASTDSVSAPPQSTVHSINPVDNPDGTGPGLSALSPRQHQAQVEATITALSTAPRPGSPDYERSEFGPTWTDTASGIAFSGNRCSTRDDILTRDLTAITRRDECVVTSGTLSDPYTNATIAFTKRRATDVAIDHVYPLSLSWRNGAHQWTAETRKAFANDPLNLIATSGRVNSSKGDSSPSRWLPPHPNIHCAYSYRFAQVATKYSLPITDADKATMLHSCAISAPN